MFLAVQSTVEPEIGGEKVDEMPKYYCADPRLVWADAPRSFAQPRPPRVVARDGDKIYREARAEGTARSPTYRMVSSPDSSGSAESQSDAAPRGNMFKLLLIIEAPEISS